LLVSLVDSLTNLFGSTSTPGIPTLSLGYPLILGMATVFLPIATSALLIGFFALFSILGRTVVGEEDNDTDDIDNNDDEETVPVLSTDFAALGAAVLSTGLLAPPAGAAAAADGSLSSSWSSIVAIGALGGMISVLFRGQQELEQTSRDLRSPERIRMDTWDDRLDLETKQLKQQRRRRRRRRQNSNKNSNNKKS
jgi:hypothetical protein